MNSGDYLAGYIEWQHPSPSSTPHAINPYAYPLVSPVKSDDSFSNLHTQWLTPGTTHVPSRGPASAITSPLQDAFIPDAQRVSRTSSKRRHNGVYARSDQHAIAPMDLPTGWPDSRTTPAPSTSNSFQDRFEATGLDDFTFTDTNFPNVSTPYPQIHTPPPTRDTSSTKRRLQHSLALSIKTPTAEAFRRMSSPAVQWSCDTIKHTETFYQQANVPSSHIDTEHWQIHGPASRSFEGDSSIFWNSDRTVPPSSFAMCSSISEDPFAPAPWDNAIACDSTSQQPQQQQQHQAPQLPLQLQDSQQFLHFQHDQPSTEQFRRATPMARLRAQSASRPRSAGPFSANHIVTRPRPMSFVAPSVPSGVEPNLSMGGQSSNAHTPVVNPFSASFPVDIRKPHQSQLDHMHREKELHLAGKAAPRQSKPRQLTTTPGSGLRRSMTDSRARSRNSPSRLHEPRPIIEVNDLTDSMRNTHIPRDSSPLKRHRSDAPRPSFFSTQRQSVVLMVDEEGHARTEVRPILDIPNNEDSIHAVPDGASPTKNLDLSHAPSMTQLTEGSGTSAENASDARSEIVVGRWRRRRRGADVMHEVSDADLSDNRSSVTEVPRRPPTLDLSCSESSGGLFSAESQPSTASSNFSISVGQPEMYPFPSTTMQASSVTSGVVPKSFAHHDVQYPLQCSSCKTTYGMTSDFQQAQIFVCDFCISAMNRRCTSSTMMYDSVQNDDWY